MALHERLAFLRPRLDLGVGALVPEWRKLVSRDGLARDLEQGILLAAITLPLSLLLAALSGAPASSGVISAAIGSAVCVLIGGTRVALSGPGVATALVASAVVGDHGILGLGLTLIACGVLQLLTGALGFGRYVKLVPGSVIRGIVLGTGAAILLAQLPLAVGAPLESDAGILERLDHLGQELPRVDPLVLAVAVASAILGLLSFLHRRIPGALIGTALATAAVAVSGLDLPTLHEVDHLPMPSLPHLPSTGLAQLVGSALELYGLSTLATLASTRALDRISPEPTDPDQELIANGLATTLVGFLHGLPTMQLIARSAAGVRLGVVSRRPALVQAVVVLALGLAAFPWMRHVPLAGLTGVALVVALPLLDPRPLRDLGRISRIDASIGVVAALTTVFGGIVIGLIVGSALGFAAAAFRLARTRAMLQKSKDPSAPHQLSFNGPVTFLAQLEMEKLRADLAVVDPGYGLIVDLRSVIAIDATGALTLVAVLDDTRARGGKVALIGPSSAVRERVLAADALDRPLPAGAAPGDLAAAIASNDREADALLGMQRRVQARPQLLAGLQRFREEMKEHYDSLFSSLADGQHPHTMFITCADSRIDPSLLMGSHPGDLFIVRAIGALVPAVDAHPGMIPEGAAVEYGVGVLGIRNIVVCGHSKCGAVGALKKAQVPAELQTLGNWAKHAAAIAGELGSFADADEAARAVTVRQVQNLLTYPLVREHHARGDLHIHAWFYDLGAVELYEWSDARRKYEVLGTESRAVSLPPAAPRIPASMDVRILTMVPPATSRAPDDTELE